eukprot:3084003-Lingulodinium_polyedra.AAC.1
MLPAHAPFSPPRVAPCSFRAPQVAEDFPRNPVLGGAVADFAAAAPRLSARRHRGEDRRGVANRRGVAATSVATAPSPREWRGGECA